jgi:hypothetical protein
MVAFLPPFHRLALAAAKPSELGKNHKILSFSVLISLDFFVHFLSFFLNLLDSLSQLVGQ